MRNSSFLAALHDLFEVDAGTIQLTSVLKDVPGWSSLTFIGLIATIDDEFGVSVSPITILNCETVADLLLAIDVEQTEVETPLVKMAA